MDCEDLRGELEYLVDHDPDRLFPDHVPMSYRYEYRGQQAMEPLIKEGVCIGSTWSKTEAVLAIYLEPTPTEIMNSIPGKYGVFRVYFTDNEVDYATLFCFYDDEPGKSDSGNKAFYTVEEAQQYMKINFGYNICE